MSWLTMDDMVKKGIYPFSLVDANGTEILSWVTEFNPETGEVKAMIITGVDRADDGTLVPRCYVDFAEGEFPKIIEKYTPPLLYRSITNEEWNRQTTKALNLLEKYLESPESSPEWVRPDLDQPVEV